MTQRTTRLVATRNVLLTAVGWIALLLYILACRPSWSPDGSKLLVSYYDPKTDEAGVAVLDRTTGNTRSVFSRPSEHFLSGIIPVQWDDAGEHAILWLKEEGELLFLPINSSEPARTLELPEEVEWNGLPIPQLGGSLYFTGDALVKIDLVTGQVITREMYRTPRLFAGSNGIWYVAATHDEVPDQDGKTVLILNGYDYGRVDEDELTLEPLFRIEKKDLEQHGIDSLGFVAFEPSGKQLAITGASERGIRIVLCDETGMQKVLTPQLSAEYVLGNIEWSPTHDTIYAAAFSSTDVEEVIQFSVAELALDGTPARLIPLGRIQGTIANSMVEQRFDENDTTPFFPSAWAFEIALTRDGSRIAASTAHGDEDFFLAVDGDRAVFLVELEDPERPVTKYPLSSWEL